MTTQPQPLDLDTIQARHHLIADPAACGTCWRLVLAGKPTEHPECARRAVLLPPPDQPSDEDLADLTDEEKAALPARFHTPVWEGLAVPHSWVCAVCYGDGWTTAWPCKTALQHGETVFTPEHQADRARDDVPALLAHIADLEQQLAAHQNAITAVRALDKHAGEASDDRHERYEQLDPENYQRARTTDDTLWDVMNAIDTALGTPR